MHLRYHLLAPGSLQAKGVETSKRGIRSWTEANVISVKAVSAIYCLWPRPSSRHRDGRKMDILKEEVRGHGVGRQNKSRTSSLASRKASTPPGDGSKAKEFWCGRRESERKRKRRERKREERKGGDGGSGNADSRCYGLQKGSGKDRRQKGKKEGTKHSIHLTARTGSSNINPFDRRLSLSPLSSLSLFLL